VSRAGGALPEDVVTGEREGGLTVLVEDAADFSGDCCAGLPSATKVPLPNGFRAVPTFKK
jgi:hypothetical protein